MLDEEDGSYNALHGVEVGCWHFASVCRLDSCP